MTFSLRMARYNFVRCAKKKVAAERKFTVQQQVGREKHIRAMQRASKKKSTQSLLQERDNKSSDFHKNFCEALVSAPKYT